MTDCKTRNLAIFKVQYTLATFYLPKSATKSTVDFVADLSKVDCC